MSFINRIQFQDAGPIFFRDRKTDRKTETFYDLEQRILSNPDRKAFMKRKAMQRQIAERVYKLIEEAELKRDIKRKVYEMLRDDDQRFDMWDMGPGTYESRSMKYEKWQRIIHQI